MPFFKVIAPLFISQVPVFVDALSTRISEQYGNLESLEEAQAEGKKVVWVSGWARSGTSTVLSMISAAGNGKSHIGGGKGKSNVFALFEPCKDKGDVYDHWLEKKECDEVLNLIASCEFKAIHALRGWNNSHTSKPGIGDMEAYSSEKAKRSCQKAPMVVFKTINVRIGPKVIKKMFKDIPNFHIVDVVRDPRAVYASDKENFGRQANISHLQHICEYASQNHESHHDGLIRVVFEDLIRNPLETVKAVYRQIGLRFGETQKKWVDENFDATSCKKIRGQNKSYSDCHTNSGQSIWSWRKVLSDFEKQSFKKIKACSKVAKVYGWPLL